MCHFVNPLYSMLHSFKHGLLLIYKWPYYQLLVTLKCALEVNISLFGDQNSLLLLQNAKMPSILFAKKYMLFLLPKSNQIFSNWNKWKLEVHKDTFCLVQCHFHSLFANWFFHQYVFRGVVVV